MGEIAAELARRGHDVTILCQSGSAAAEGVKVRTLGRGGAFRTMAIRAFANAVRGEIREGRYDVVHATLPVPEASIYQPRGGTIPGQAAAKRRMKGPAAALLSRATMPLNPARALSWCLEKAIVSDTKTVCLCVSELVRQEFVQYYGRTENVRVVYSGVEVPSVTDQQRQQWRERLREKWGADGETTVFLSVAENFELKGVPETIAAFGQFVRQGVDKARLVLAGGRELAPYRRLADKSGVAGQVVFESHVEDVFPLYSAADAVVLLSWQDACSRVILEAIRWGVPSVTTRYNGAAELLARGGGRVIESPRDTLAAVAAMAELADPARRLAMADACRKAADFVSMKRQVDELEAVYRSVSAKKP